MSILRRCAFVPLQPMLVGARRSDVAEDRAVSGLHACSRNRKFRRHQHRSGDFSNFASRDEKRARLLPVRTRRKVSSVVAAAAGCGTKLNRGCVSSQSASVPSCSEEDSTIRVVTYSQVIPRAYGRFLRAIQFESAGSRRADCIAAATGDRFFRASAESPVRL